MTPPNIDLKALWQQQDSPPPAVKTMLQSAQKFQQQQLLQYSITTIALLATAIFVGWIWWFYQPELWTTKLGIVLVIVSITIFIGFQSALLPLFLKENNQLSSKEYLLLVQQLQQKKKTLQTTILSLYFVLLSTGLALYFYEYTLLMAVPWAIVVYVTTALWIAFNWWYLRPKIIKKQQLEIEILVQQLKQLEEQLKE